jgi:hypothetical protein
MRTDLLFGDMVVDDRGGVVERLVPHNLLRR